MSACSFTVRLRADAEGDDDEEEVDPEMYVSVPDYDQALELFGDGTENQWRMTENELNSLPTVVSGQFQCPCCLEIFNNHETTRLAQCDHLMCNVCTRNAIPQSNTHAICRSPLNRLFN